ncbi:MAG TPA: glycosyltransferase [Kofleriaceae bacterium]|nr:glycosyltransferase [Kofleriaceae bacterium]
MIAAARPLRIAFHAINGVGLGHLVRTVSIANELPALIPGVVRLVLTNARDPSLLVRAGIDFVQLPPRLNEPHADPARVHTALPEPLEEAALVAALTAFAPDLVVFDTHAPIRVVRRVAALGARAVLVLRELRPAALRAFVASGAGLAFDRIVVPHDPGEVDLAAFGALPVILSGPIVRTLDGALREQAGSYERSGSRIVAIAGGGGQPVDARRYLRAVADAHWLARARIPDLETVLVTGPYAEAPAHLEGFAGLHILGSTPDLPALLARASLVISQAGYNAIAELRALEKPAILVPAYRKAEDQRARALRLVQAGAAVIARPRARSLADAIEALLLTPGALDAMHRAHRTIPLVARNRAAAEAVIRPVRLVRRTVSRVALVAHDFAPKLGGMETVARTLAHSLVERGVEVGVYTTNRLGVGATGLGDCVQPLYRPLPRPRRIDLWPDLLATIDAALRDAPDVIHLCHAGLGPWIPALRAALPCVVTANVHGNDLLAPWVSHGGDPAAYRDAQLAGLGAADAVVCVSQFSLALAAARGVPAGVLHTVENGADPARFCPGPRDPALAARLGLSDGDEVVLTVSRLAPRKGHRAALHAIARLAPHRPRLRYVFTGASESMRAELATLAHELGIAARVIAAGFVPDAELPALYRLADVFVLLAGPATDTDVEGFGVALLEAAATGLPVVATASGGVPEAIGDTGVLVAPGDPIAAADAIGRLLADRDAARQLGDQARRRVVEAFSQDRVTDRMLAIWNGVLAQGPRAPTNDLSVLRAAWAEPPAGSSETPAPTGRHASPNGSAEPARGTPPPPDVREALAQVANGVELVRIAQRHQAARRADRGKRRDMLRGVIARDRLVRLRATSDGARLLPDALEDCIALGHAPRVEVKLRRFAEPDFVAHALPFVEGVELVHGVPHTGAAALLAQLRALPDAALAKVRTLRLFLSPAAQTDGRLAASAVPEAHALRRWFAARGTTVVPPPELMRYLSELPARGPETGMIEPTNLCNLACPTCPTGTGKVKPLPQMTLDRFEHVLGGLAPRLRNLALWNYGEPLLNKHLPQMIAHAKQAGVGVVKVSSNVHFLDGERGRALLGSGLDVLILSVDGASQDTYQTFRKDGDFAHVARSVAWLCAEKRRLGLAKPRIELQFIVMRHNEHELPEMRRLARDWGVDALRIKTVGADDEAQKHLVPAQRLLSRYAADGETPNVRHSFCTMAWDHTVVNVDGSVTPCCYLRPDMAELAGTPGGRDAYVMGNVFEQPFTAIWRGERYRAFRAQMLAGRGELPICNKCRGGTHDLIAAVEEVARP